MAHESRRGIAGDIYIVTDLRFVISRLGDSTTAGEVPPLPDREIRTQPISYRSEAGLTGSRFEGEGDAPSAEAEIEGVGGNRPE